ncbi:helix-turn-helix domain-containing protein [Corynebacterium sp. LK33]|uniref:helix-turn-helix domain-containing protein n=1 Tax=Corynebacterium sp. LK33 TaxID=2044574 RepID=UPI0016524A36|nr:helix-turn-helix transcriptional regulator [Corynebacterium sp. LK33]
MDWERELTVQIGRAIDERRNALGLSAQALSDKTAELGHKISRSAIADYSNEKRRPRVSVADLLVLARALETPPVYLLFPNAPGGRVTYLPGETESAGAAAEMFSGYYTGFGDSDWEYFTGALRDYLDSFATYSLYKEQLKLDNEAGIDPATPSETTTNLYALAIRSINLTGKALSQAARLTKTDAPLNLRPSRRVPNDAPMPKWKNDGAD